MKTTSKTCARCGQELSLGSALDVCPRCIAALALAQDLLVATRPAGASSEASLEKMEDRIDRYRLLEKIGEGGCGVVYVADQEEPVRRRVALKVIKLGMDTRAVVARFEAERQALALMDHPHIAKVFDGGCTSTGRPYFVMELVRGTRITRYCDECRLSTAQRLELFTQVCHAVQHAHQKGIIHRDLKPSNVLVTINDGVAVPKVIDFGVAKATSGQTLTDKTVYTAFEQFIGTPAYMSPEQTLLTSLDIDTRSDIYSLGVLLYELLTGELPFDPHQLLASGIEGIRRTIREQEPMRPSTRLGSLVEEKLTTAANRRSSEVNRLLHDVRGDVDWIVSKCLEKDRNRRYETANELAADIQRHLRNEPILARPPSKMYRFRKWARRNRALVTGVGMTLVALAIGLALATWAWVGERAARRQAAVEAARSATVAKFHQEMIDSLRPSVAMGRDTTLLREFADKSFETLGKDLGNEPIVEFELRASIARVYGILGENRKAEAIYEELVPRMKSYLGSNHVDLAPVLRRYSEVLHKLKRSAEAEATARQSLVLTQKSKGPDHADTAYSLMLIGNALHSQKNYREAEKYQRLALSTYQKVYGPEHREIAQVLGNLGVIVESEERLAEAEVLYGQSQRMLKRLLGPGHPEMVWITEQLARFHLFQKKNLKEATHFLEELLEEQRKLLGNENRQVARTLATLAGTMIDNGNPEAGEKVARESLALHRKLYGMESAEVATVMHDLAIAVSRLNREPEAELLLREAIEMDRKFLPSQTAQLERALNTLALTLHAQGKLAEAESPRRERLELGRADLERQRREPSNLEQRIYELADNLYDQGKFAEADPFYRELIQHRAERLPADDPDLLNAKSSRARSLADWAWSDGISTTNTIQALKRAKEAEGILRDCLAIWLQGDKRNHWRVSDVRSRLGGALLSVLISSPSLSDGERQNRFREIEGLMLQGYEGLIAHSAPNTKQKRGTLERLVRLYEIWNKPIQADYWNRRLVTFDQPESGKTASVKAS